MPSYDQQNQSRAMVIRGSRDVSMTQRSADSDSDSNSSKSSTKSSIRQPTSHLPSQDEMDRMERYMALQERAVALSQKRVIQGHTYGNITVTGNARAIRGNLCEDSVNMPFTYKHSYGVGTVHGNGMIWDGDISISALKAMRQGQSTR